MAMVDTLMGCCHPMAIHMALSPMDTRQLCGPFKWPLSIHMALYYYTAIVHTHSINSVTVQLDGHMT
jgi:hypothetical protein